MLLAILAAGVLVGLETNAALVASHGTLLHFFDHVILVVFIVEILLRLAALGRRWPHFFTDPWHVFDFAIVVILLLPSSGPFAAVLRLARILRVLRLVSFLPQLQMLVGAFLKSIPSLFYVGLLLGLHFYIYAVLGTHFFHTTDPTRFGNLPETMLTLFKVVTLEGWVEIMEMSRTAHPIGAAVYFVSFILLGTMIMLNLLIGVIVHGMDEAREEALAAARAKHGDSTHELMTAMEEHLRKMQTEMAELRRRLDAKYVAPKKE
ncbi:MAG: ion transporter [Verrucomicrobia bacterium]|nr:ion transporter [Verrucomicrobiota bacterium]